MYLYRCVVQNYSNNQTTKQPSNQQKNRPANKQSKHARQ